MVKHKKKYNRRKCVNDCENLSPKSISDVIDLCGIICQMLLPNEKTAEQNIEEAVEKMNENSRNDLENGRQLLVDTPIISTLSENADMQSDEYGCSQDCQECTDCQYCPTDDLLRLDLIKDMTVRNAINANDLRNGRKLLSNDIASAILEDIFGLIKDLDDERSNSLQVDLIEDYEELLEDVTDESMLRLILDKIYIYITNQGYYADLEYSKYISGKDIKHAILIIEW